MGLVHLSGFDLGETSVVPATADWRRLWQRGGFPRSYLALDDTASEMWRQNFVSTFLERDVPQLGITIPAEALRRFWSMIAHCHGRVWNAEFAGAIGTTRATVRRHLGHSERLLHGAGAAALAREPQEAPSEGTEGPCA